MLRISKISLATAGLLLTQASFAAPQNIIEDKTTLSCLWQVNEDLRLNKIQTHSELSVTIDASDSTLIYVHGVGYKVNFDHRSSGATLVFINKTCKNGVLQQ